MTAADRRIVLCADDFALTEGICDAVTALAEADRLSATSAIVTAPHWPRRARSIGALRSRIAVGLHLNLTFGAPLGPMPRLAPNGELPPAGKLVATALRGGLDLTEIGAEIGRQIDHFEHQAGFAPDFVDGHNHAHVLPGIRGTLLDQLSRRYRGRRLLIRNPADRPGAIVGRRTAAAKALTACALAAGMGRQVEAAGFLVNNGFSGYSTFGSVPYAREFETFLIARGNRHIIMCHPGLADAELGSRDEIAGRRPEEYEVLARYEGLADMLWHPSRALDCNSSAFSRATAA